MKSIPSHEIIIVAENVRSLSRKVKSISSHCEKDDFYLIIYRGNRYRIIPNSNGRYGFTCVLTRMVVKQ